MFAINALLHTVGKLPKSEGYYTTVLSGLKRPVQRCAAQQRCCRNTQSHHITGDTQLIVVRTCFGLKPIILREKRSKLFSMIYIHHAHISQFPEPSHPTLFPEI